MAGQAVLLAVCNRVDRARQDSGLTVTMEPRSEPAADLIVEQPDGSKLQLTARSGRFQLLHFWATWCPPCRRELPLLFEMARRNRARLDVWAISTDPEWSSVRRFFGASVPSPVVRDPSGAGWRALSVTTLPDSYLVGPDGRIRARFSGAQHWTSEKMGKILDQLMRES